MSDFTDEAMDKLALAQVKKLLHRVNEASDVPDEERLTVPEGARMIADMVYDLMDIAYEKGHSCGCSSKANDNTLDAKTVWLDN